jgi:hypothetical protein
MSKPSTKSSTALYNLRGFVILIVVAFHSFLAYLGSQPSSTAQFDAPLTVGKPFRLPMPSIGSASTCSAHRNTSMSCNSCSFFPACSSRGGVKINPVEVEAMIDRHPKVLQSAIVPMPDEVMGEKACAFIVTRPGERASLQEICEWLAQNDVAKMQWPEHVELIDEMPMTSTRKII